MYLRRGVLPAVATSPTYTFGAPAIFCEGNCSPAACRVPDTADHEVLPPLQRMYSRAAARSWPALWEHGRDVSSKNVGNRPINHSAEQAYHCPELSVKA